MKAVVRRMSPHNVLSCCLKFCTASAHLMFSEASPPTYHLKDGKEREMSDGRHRAVYLVKEITGHMSMARSPSKPLCILCHHAALSISHILASGNTPAPKPLLFVVHHMSCGMIISSGCRLQGSALSTCGDNYTNSMGCCACYHSEEYLGFSSFSSLSAGDNEKCWR